MTKSEFIYKKANAIVKRAGTRDALKISQELGFELRFVDYFSRLIGMYVYQHKVKAIIVNNRLDQYMLQMVVAHEIGHDLLHRDLAKQGGLQEFTLFDMKNITEYEANAFAAHLLIDTDEFVELAREGREIEAIASSMNANINLALIKLNELRKLGYDLRMPMEARGDFLKDVEL